MTRPAPSPETRTTATAERPGADASAKMVGSDVGAMCELICEADEG